jgi:TolA-binding protein
MPNEKPIPAPPEPTEEEKATARRWFDHAKKAAETKNYDYAVDLYVRGLGIWPEATEEGLKPLRVVGTARRLAGKKPPGFLETRKYPTSGKDPRKNLTNALHLFGLDPGNPDHLETILLNAAKAGYMRIALWIAPILWEGFSTRAKVNAARCSTLYQALDRIGEWFQEKEDYPASAEIFRLAQYVADLWKERFPRDSEGAKALGDASSKLTIVKGRFGTNEDFRGSLKDGESQRALHDEQRGVQTESRTRQLIDKARAEYEADPNSAARISKLAEMLTRLEDPADEKEAIALLKAGYERTGVYALKMRADDIHIRHLRRAWRAANEKARAQPNDESLRQIADETRRGLVEEELGIIEERIRHYPTDMRLRYERGLRLFDAGRIDEAIPTFQQAQSEPSRRNAARLYIGRCFYEKRFYSQAIETLRTAAADHEITDDDLAKELVYWIGRACEDAGKREDAKQAYGQLIQVDYNFRDARQRLEALHTSGA